MSDRQVNALRERAGRGMTCADIARVRGVSVGYAYRLSEQVMVEIYLARDG